MSLFKRKKTEDKEEQEQDKKPEQFKPAKKVKQPKEKDAKDKKPQKRDSQVAYKVLIHPLITEKSTIQNSYNQYAFAVDSTANKVEIKKAIEEIYHIKPTKIRIINILGKQVRSGRGKFTSRKNWKKAIVTIPAGKKIDVYEGV